MVNKFVQLLSKYYLPNKIIWGNYSSSVKKLPKSSLLISGQRAVDTFIVVIPHLDFNERFADFQELEKNVKRRKLDIIPAEMKQIWDFYNEWNGNKLKLEENISEITKRILELKNLEENKTEIEKLDIRRALAKEDLQNVKKNVWSMEDDIICELLKLPNIIHSETPEIEKEITVFSEENINKDFDHLCTGVKLNYLEYRNEFTYFLKNKAALFEIAVPELFIDLFEEVGFVRFSNPDFSRSVLAEGVGVAPNEASDLFLLENTEGNNDLLHLCGGASLFPFCGYHAKHTVQKQSLPVKYIAAGRQYCPDNISLPGLYSVKQSTSAQIFVASFSEEEIYNEFQIVVKKLQNIYCDMGLNFKIVKQPPNVLKRWESLRVSIQVYSPHLKLFVQVGSVSLIGDFISKRLRMCFTDKKEESFLNILSGNIVNVETLLALCLERSDNDLFIPSVLNNHMI